MKGFIYKHNIFSDENNNYNIDVIINEVKYNFTLKPTDKLSTLYTEVNIQYNKYQRSKKKEDFEYFYVKNNKKITQKYWIINETIDELYLCDTYDKQYDKIPNNKINVNTYFSDELLPSNYENSNILLDSYCNILQFLKSF
jgi:hypothetical protein|tara:strand:- start:127 stop:549 length:423 start_codon:yes stop_codon:yes gene_type:complete